MTSHSDPLPAETRSRVERAKARAYADKAMNNLPCKLGKIDWLHMWGVVREAHLNGLRSKS